MRITGVDLSVPVRFSPYSIEFVFRPPVGTMEETETVVDLDPGSAQIITSFSCPTSKVFSMYGAGI